jgi:hypothetical protein
MKWTPSIDAAREKRNTPPCSGSGAARNCGVRLVIAVEAYEVASAFAIVVAVAFTKPQRKVACRTSVVAYLLKWWFARILVRFVLVIYGAA